MNNNYKEINEKLKHFIATKQVPNIIFHGDCFTKKEEIVTNFIRDIYNDEDMIKKYVMYVDCAHGKGIKFVREDLKHFSKTNISKTAFKSIILNNADKLTIDAQSALRRCIEIFSHSTRFFMIVDNVSKLLKPILSRFCSLLVFEKNNKICNDITYDQKIKKISNEIDKLSKTNLFDISEKLYDKGISGLNLLTYLESKNNVKNKTFLLFYINKVKKDIRDERLLMVIILNTLIYSDSINLKTTHYI
jgi:DNA polymerase III delta prime subunit